MGGNVIKNDKVYSTGWFVGNDLDAALEASMNTDNFITTFSDATLAASDIKGLLFTTKSTSIE